MEDHVQLGSHTFCRPPNYWVRGISGSKVTFHSANVWVYVLHVHWGVCRYILALSECVGIRATRLLGCVQVYIGTQRMCGYTCYTFTGVCAGIVTQRMCGYTCYTFTGVCASIVTQRMCWYTCYTLTGVCASIVTQRMCGYMCYTLTGVCAGIVTQRMCVYTCYTLTGVCAGIVHSSTFLL